MSPILRWGGDSQGKDGTKTLPWPEYEPIVLIFFQVASRECWIDYNYHPEKARQMIEDAGQVKAADIMQIKTMLTYCVRGERFCDGHWGRMIQEGYVRRLLERLMELI
ncbi:MAG: DUF6508 domain-containing protein [Acidobacteriota bacterium]|nr:DUF6508 domain-containing protein [Blastocatellia bacterium]MDW8411849.1 DUF6508 domain-containing protein [Acidobacteriota bacterium]